MLVRWIVALAWLYIVVLMAAAEAIAPNGSVLGALLTLLLYGLAPLALVGYLLGTPARRARRRAQEALAAAPDRGDQAAGDAVAPERKEP